MKKPLFFLIIFLVSAGGIDAASRVLIPIVQQPQDAVDLGVLIPSTGLKIAIYDYKPDENFGAFIIIKNGSIVNIETRNNIFGGEELGLIEDCESFVIEARTNSVDMIFSCLYPYVVVLANPIDLNLSSVFIGFLQDKGIVVDVINSSKFNDFKDAPTIIILGGPDALQGVGEITRDILSENEQSFLRTKGKRGMFVKENPWYPGADKTVSVIAGSDRYETQKAVLENQHRFIL